MLLLEHTLAQPPQLLASLMVLISQPSASLLLLQSAKPVLQAPLHTPAAQVGVEMLLLEHTLAQPPQLLASLLMLTAQPSVSLFPLQSAKPVPQVPLHTPAAQVGEVMLLVE